MIVKALLGVALGALVAVQVRAIDEGIDYTTLAVPQPTESGDKIEVLEVFMYSCPHCFHLEPTLEKWLATKPENVEFKRMPAVFGPKAEPHARAFYAAELIGKGKEFHLPLFRALHVEKKHIWDEDALVAFAEEQGIDGDRFRNAYDSFFVNMRVHRAEDMVKRYGVDGVPTIIVNGKYRTSPSQTGGREEMFRVVDYLIQVESSPPAADEATPSSSEGT